MNLSINKVIIVLSLTLGLALNSTNIFAAGPLEVCNTGQAFAWANGGDNVPFNPDAGDLGILTNAQATQAVADAFNAWGDVATATINYQNTGTLPVDVDVTNFAPFLQPEAPDGLSAIVFDDNGEIFDLLFGADSGVLGFASPEFTDVNTCTILEGFSFLNGPAIDSLEGLLDLMVHEFGHYSNLAHTEVNGQLFIGVGDSSGPGTDNTFGDPEFPDGMEVIETMYPFLFGGIDQVARTPNADDIASLSRIYPSDNYASTTGTITGTISFGNSRVTGVNVIARNIDNPFADAVSAISSDFTRDYTQANPATGTYTITGLTPGASYAVYVDEILNGGFSTPLASPLPGPEEFYNGANESSNSSDIPNEFVPVVVTAGTTVSNIDIQFAVPEPGTPLATGDDGNVQIPLPFNFCVAGKAFDSVFINGNGFLTLGTPDNNATNFSESPATFLSGPPRIAGFWDDLAPNISGSVSYENSYNKFTVTWDSVPEFSFSDGGSNTFSVTLKNNSYACTRPRYSHHYDDGYQSNHYGYGYGYYYYGSDVKIWHGDISALDGLVGVSTGAFSTSTFETESDLSYISYHGWKSLSLRRDAAIFEQFSGDDVVDIANSDLRFRDLGRTYRDRFERNDSLRRARVISLPFDSINTSRSYTSIAPEADDIDFYRFKRKLAAGTTIVAEVLSGQIDTVMGLYQCDESPIRRYRDRSKRCKPSTAELVAFNDDSNGLLSRIVYQVPTDGTYALAVSFCCDNDLDGVDPGQGGVLDEGRYVLDIFTVDGQLLELTDESFSEVDLGFSFPYQGQSYESVFVNSNGYLSFGASGTSDFSPSVAELESGFPRIASLWSDLNPSAGGMVVAADEDDGTKTISFMGVPNFASSNSNTFAVTLKPDGGVDLAYAQVDTVAALTGVAAGEGNVSTAVDLSETADLSAVGSTHEQFIAVDNEFDLTGETLSFEP